MKWVKRYLALICSAFMLLSSIGIVSQADGTQDPSAEGSLPKTQNTVLSYEEYKKGNSDKTYGEKQTLTAGSITEKSANAEISENINETGEGGVIIPDDGFVSWNINVPADCYYTVNLRYIAAERSSGNLELEFNIDGEIPFSEVSLISFERLYSQKDGTFAKNKNGNDVKPDVEEILIWQEKPVMDASGYNIDPLDFHFTAGEHTVTLKGSRGKTGIASVTLSEPEKTVSYKEYQNKAKAKTNNNTKTKEIEAEHFKYKNSATILPSTDKSSTATSPQSASALLLNSMGGDNWKTIGSAATWEFTVDDTGMYEISTRFLQNTKDGIFTCRKLYIDGEVPFEEANFIRFNYSSDWQCEKIGAGDKPFKFYLEKGKHTLTLEATAGEVSDIIGTVAKSVNQLNKINRRIKLITGNKVDKNRDYNFKALIPDEIKQLGEIKKDLQKSVDYINKQAGSNGSFVAILQKVIFQLDKMSSNPRSIPKYLERFQSNLGAMGEWLLSATEQPLKLDKIYIQPENSKTPKASASFFAEMWYVIKSFVYSFTVNYNTLGSEENSGNRENITVWVQTGRDQGQVIRDLIDSSFYKDNGNIGVKVQVVSSGLLQSVLAGISPDVVTNCAETLPLEYALRNAVTDMTEFSDYEEVFSRFSKASVKPATFNGKVYGMPQTYSYLMLFYRTDIFKEFGYTVPKTWDDLRAMIPSLQRNGMEVGLPHTLDVYATFLYQNGGELYKGNGKETNLSDYTSIVSFANMMEFFTLYNCPVTFNFANRFRSGEMPIAIVPYTEYNQLTAFAPEIKGMWKMVPIPGTKDKNGNINNTAVGNSTFSVIMRSSEHKQASWEFLKWFMSSDVQSDYAIRMESILGTCAKVDSANIEALSKMTWSSSEYREFFTQMENIDSVPQVPGGYYLSRIFGFAFNRVYNKNENPKEVLRDYIKEINDELTRKRAEFGLGDE